MSSEVSFWYKHDEIKAIVADIDVLKYILSRLKNFNQNFEQKCDDETVVSVVKTMGWVMYDHMTLYARNSFEFLDDSLNDTRDMKEFYDVLASVYGIARRYADIDDEPKYSHHKRNLPSYHEEKTQKIYKEIQKETSVVFLNPFITVKQLLIW